MEHLQKLAKHSRQKKPYKFPRSSGPGIPRGPQDPLRGSEGQTYLNNSISCCLSFSLSKSHMDIVKFSKS